MMRTIVTLALFVATLTSAQGLETANTNISKQDSLLQDYDYFFCQLEQIHPDPYSAFGGKDEFDKAANSPRLIIDLRGNGGGWTMIMYAALYELYGKRFMDTDLGMHSATKVSEGWLKKNNMSLEQLNQNRGTTLKMGDFIEQSSSISTFDWFMCADMSILEAQNGEPIYTPKEIYVVTDVQTFSAAFHTAYMLWKMGAKVIGVPSGQAPNTYMEVTRFKLPNTSLECSVSNSLQICFPKDHAKAKIFHP
jgi:hypothetical protein